MSGGIWSLMSSTNELFCPDCLIKTREKRDFKGGGTNKPQTGSQTELRDGHDVGLK